jgi:hypothetical protein
VIASCETSAGCRVDRDDLKWRVSYKGQRYCPAKHYTFFPHLEAAVKQHERPAPACLGEPPRSHRKRVPLQNTALESGRATANLETVAPTSWPGTAPAASIGGRSGIDQK